MRRTVGRGGFISRLGPPPLFGALIAYALAPLVTMAIPAVNNLLATSLGFDPITLGLFSASDASGTGAGALMAALLTARTSPRVVAQIGILLVLLANLVSIGLQTASGMIVLRFAGGIGAGLTLSSCAYVLGFGNAERNYGWGMLSMMAAAAGVISILPEVGAHFGWQGMFGFLALLLVPALVAVTRFPQSYEVARRGDGPAEAGKLPFLWGGLASVALMTLSEIAFFNYLGSIGHAAGVSHENVDKGLSISGLVAFLGAAIAIGFSRQISNLAPIALILVVDVIGMAVANSPFFAWYTIGISVFYATIPLYATAVFGLLMRYAPARSFAVSISAAQFLGTAVAPAIGGLAVEHIGYVGLQIFCAATALLGFFSLTAAAVARNLAGGGHPPSQTFELPLAQEAAR